RLRRSAVLPGRHARDRRDREAASGGRGALTDPGTVRLAREDDVPALRALINLAYKVLGDMGLNFTGVTQDEETTRRRMTRGDVYVLERDGALLGTVTFSVKESDVDGTRYGYVNVLAVAPSHQPRGVGSEL